MLESGAFLNPHGVGMGLSICKLVTEQLGGKVWVNSKPNEGSKFGFSFKFERASAQSNFTANSEEQKRHKERKRPCKPVKPTRSMMSQQIQEEPAEG